MKKIFTPILIFVLLTMVLLYAGCKKSDEVEEFTLTVIVNEGVNGTPEAGTYTYTAGSVVQYDYALADGFQGLTVLVDGVATAASGTLTISGNHTLSTFSSQGTGEFLLNVSLATGVAGTPEAGFYYYDDGDQVDYSYTLEDGYANLLVTLDGIAIENSGTITVSQEHRLNAFAEKQFNVLGTWTLDEAYANQAAFTVTVTFSGDAASGTVVDSDGGTGTYTVDGDDINFTLVFPDITYEYVGTFSDDENMSGESRRYTSPVEYSSGGWAATKNTTAAKSQRASGGKGNR